MEIMKKIFLLTCVLCSAITYAQMEVPKKVSSAFENKFDGAESVEWSMANNGYEAKFELDEISKTSIFSKEGKWIQTGTFIESADVDSPVMDKLSDKFGEFEYETIELIETPKEAFYQFNIITEEEEKYIVQISKTGSVLNSTLIVEDNDTNDYEDDSDDEDDNN